MSVSDWLDEQCWKRMCLLYRMCNSSWLINFSLLKNFIYLLFNMLYWGGEAMTVYSELVSRLLSKFWRRLRRKKKKWGVPIFIEPENLANLWFVSILIALRKFSIISLNIVVILFWINVAVDNCQLPWSWMVQRLVRSLMSFHLGLIQRLRKNMLNSPNYFKNSQKFLTLIGHGRLSLIVVWLLLFKLVRLLLGCMPIVIKLCAWRCWLYFYLTFFIGDPMATFSISQASLLANKRRKYTLSAHISKGNDGNSVNFTWTPFPIEMIGVSTIVPSPSGSKFLTVRNPENDSPVQLEIWSAGQIEKEFHIPQSIHGSIYTDGW